MIWGVCAYNDWRIVKPSGMDTYNDRIFNSDLNNVANLDKTAFEFSMCKFLAEVVKVKDGSEYLGCTLYQFCVAIQKYLFSKRLKWKFIEGKYNSLRTILDNLIKERAAQSIGTMFIELRC